jgi:hypothetical protein
LDRGCWGDCWSSVGTVSGALETCSYFDGMTFVYLCVTFRGSPFIHYTPVSSLLCVYNDSRDNSHKLTPSPSLCYSLTHTHWSIGYHNQTHPLTETVTRLMYLRVHHIRDNSHKLAHSLSLYYSLTHTHRSIGYHNQTQSLSESTTNLMYLRVYDNRDNSRKVTPYPSLY